MRDLHAEIERLLAATGLEVTVLRPGMFASNALHWWAPQIRGGDVVRWPYAAAETAPVDEQDVAAVAARVLLDARHARGDYVLTGPESLSQAAQVQTIGEAIGRPLRLVELSPDAFRHETAGTWPDGAATMLLAAWRATLGQPAFVTSAVHDLLGAPPRTFHQWALDHAAAFAGPSRSAPGEGLTVTEVDGGPSPGSEPRRRPLLPGRGIQLLVERGRIVGGGIGSRRLAL